jgi:TRAP-type mannitol/chloroaromatic compound transport system substrate-binding protein
MQTKQGVKFFKTPDSVLRTQLKVFDDVVAKKSAENPLFKKIVDSQKEFARRAVKWDLDVTTGRRMAFDHYFGQPAAPAKKA